MKGAAVIAGQLGNIVKLCSEDLSISISLGSEVVGPGREKRNVNNANLEEMLKDYERIKGI